MKAKFISEAIKHLSPRSENEIARALEFDVEYTDDMEGQWDNEYKKLKNYNEKHEIKTTSVTGRVTNDSTYLVITFSDNNRIVLHAYFPSGGPSRFKEHATMDLLEDRINCTEQWIPYLEKYGSFIIAALKLYEDIKIGNFVRKTMNI